MTAGELHDRLSLLGADLLARALGGAVARLARLRAAGRGGRHLRRKIAKAEARIDWARPARAVHDHIRGLSPFPGAWFEADSGPGTRSASRCCARRLAGGRRARPARCSTSGLTIACGEGAVRLLEVQRAGKAPMPADGLPEGRPARARRAARADAALQAPDRI